MRETAAERRRRERRAYEAGRRHERRAYEAAGGPDGAAEPRGDRPRGRERRTGGASARTGGAGSGTAGGTGGVPDGLLLGGLALVLGMAVLVWTATGLAGLFAHGAWPDGVSFGNTPTAIRELLAEPHDMPAAWPSTPREQLTGYGLFWGLFLGQVLVLIVLTVFVLGTFSRWRVVRQRRRDEEAEREDWDAIGGPEDDWDEDDTEEDGASSEHAFPERGRAVGSWGSPDLAKRAGGAGGAGGDEAEAPGAHSPAGSPAAGSAAGSATEPLAAESPLAYPEAYRTDAPAPRPNPEPEPVLGHPHGPSNGAPTSHTPHLRPVPYGLRIAAEATTAPETVREAEGALLVVTADTELYAETVGGRAKLGPVHVYDPGQRTDAPSRLRWEPHAGCADPATARGRAGALLAPLCPPTSGDPAVHDTARTLLRCLLHAAAVAGEPFRQVHRWTASGSTKDAVRILRTHREAATGSAGELEATLTAHPERREAALELVRSALQCLSQLHVRNSCTAGRADRVAWDSFVPEQGTLFVIGEHIEAPRREGPGAMGLLTALTAATIEHGHHLATQAYAGRLDPPLTVLLDQAATVTPLPRLPELLADGPDAGLRTVALLRSTEQARAWWPELAR